MENTCTRPPAGWRCTREEGHDGPCAAWPVKPSFWRRLRNRFTICLKEGHNFFPDGATLGGDWIRCYNCWHLDEYLPGLHEPRGYKDPK